MVQKEEPEDILEDLRLRSHCVRNDPVVDGTKKTGNDSYSSDDMHIKMLAAPTKTKLRPD